MRIIFILLLLTLSIDMFGQETNLLKQRYSKEDLDRSKNWNWLCARVQVKKKNDKIVLESNDCLVKGDTLFLVEEYSTSPGNSSSLISFFSFSGDSDSILYVSSKETHKERIEEDLTSCDYKLFTILNQRNFKLLDKWNTRIYEEDISSTPSRKYFITMIYLSDKSIYRHEWSFFWSLLWREKMRDYLLGRKSKGLDYYDPDFDYLMKEDL